MNLDRMLDKCHRFQWSVDDLDWTVKPKQMSRDDEISIVQYFTDMAGIERLAKALFVTQQERTDKPVLKEIFATFVVDEERHAVTAERLARHYDVHHYKDYQLNPDLVKFQPHFINAVRYLSAEIANVYITAGELLLDVALLRSIDDYVDDDMSRQAMKLINRDESRHIAIDYHMVEYYASPEYLEWMKSQGFPGPRHLTKALWSLGNVMYHAGPFVKGVFIRPMSLVDPTGRRLKEAFKRIQLLSKREDVSKRPFATFIRMLQTTYNMRVPRMLFGPVIERVAGIPGEVLMDLHTAEEAERAKHMSFDELAEEALAAKFTN